MLFITFSWLDFLDILVVAILMYQVYLLVRGTLAIRVFLGLLFTYVSWKIVEALQMDLLSEILGQVIGVAVVALIIVFQQEIRHFLMVFGSLPFIKRLFNSGIFNSETTLQEQFPVEPMVNACEELAKSKTGALIVITRQSIMQMLSHSGVRLDAKISEPLLKSIFYDKNPLHDGAIIIANGRISRARCILPVSDNKAMSGDLGTRHRAAMGISEQSDAAVIVVSEETGKISYFLKGEVTIGLTNFDLEQKLRGLQEME